MKKGTWKNRIAALLLVVCMTIGMLPAQVFAEGGKGPVVVSESSAVQTRTSAEEGAQTVGAPAEEGSKDQAAQSYALPELTGILGHTSISFGLETRGFRFPARILPVFAAAPVLL